MATSDRPSNQKSAINTISGNAKTTGGDQPFIGSFAAPVTDNGLGQLAQGFGQAAAGVGQLALAYQQRKREDEDLVVATRLAEYTADAGMWKTQKENEFVADADPDTWADSQLKVTKEEQQIRLNAAKQGLNERQLKKFMLGAQSVDAGLQNAVYGHAMRQAIQQRTVNVKTSLDNVTAKITELTTKGDIPSVIAALRLSKDAVGQLQKMVPPETALAIQESTSQDGVNALLATFSNSLYGASGEELLTKAKEGKQQVVAVAGEIFGNNPASVARVIESVDRIEKSIVAKKQKNALEIAKRDIDTSSSAFGNLQANYTKPKVDTATLAQLSPSEKAMVIAQDALLPTRKILVTALKNHLPPDEARRALLQAEKTAAALPLEIQPEVQKLLGAMTAGFEAQVSDPNNVLQRDTLNGASPATKFQNQMRVTNGNIRLSRDNSYGKDKIAVFVSNLDHAVKQASADSGALTVEQVEGFISSVAASGIPLSGATPVTAAHDMLVQAGAPKSLQRIFAVAALAGDRYSLGFGKLTQFAAEGLQSLASKHGYTAAQLSALRAKVEGIPAIAAVRTKLNITNRGGTANLMYDQLVESIMAYGIGGTKTDSSPEAAARTVEQLIPLINKAFNTTPSGETLEKVRDNLYVPQSVSSKITSPQFKKAAAELAVTKKLFGAYGNPPFILSLTPITAPQNRGVYLQYDAKTGGKGVLQGADRKPVFLSWEEVSAMYEGQVRKPAAAQKQQPPTLRWYK